jgi:hypothetical protein
MGKLIYASAGIEVEFDDRALVHLQIVIANKLRLGESFMFSWRDSTAVGDGRSAIWLDRSIPLYYRFFGSRVPAVNRAWIEELTQSANSGTGLVLVPEPRAAVLVPQLAPV